MADTTTTSNARSAATFGGLRVVAFESRMAAPTADLITKYGGVPITAPSMREIPLEDNPDAFQFAEQLLRGAFDIVILLTGVGTRTLIKVVETRHPREQFLAALKRTTIVARGPKPVLALSEMGLAPNIRVPEPNTWRELLQTLDAQAPVAGKRVAVQEYGVPNWELLKGLKERGATVTRVPVYRWALPDDVKPLQAAIDAVVQRQADVLLFTNAAQVGHVLHVAAERGQEEVLREALDHVVVASIGPTCSETLTEAGFPVDLEPEHPKLAQFVREAAQRSRALLERKRATRPARPRTSAPQKSSGDFSSTPFMRACRRQPVPYTPVWIMRQAGRYLLEYRKVRAKASLLELCKNPDLVAEVTVTAVEQLGVDAAILFADLLLICEPLGFELSYTRGDGPVVKPTIKDGGDLDRLRRVEPQALDYVFHAARSARAALPPHIPLIGFAGAPFTLASYLIEGGASKTLQRTKMFMYRHPGAWHQLLERLVEAMALYLNGQIAAGCQAVQVFDSWVGVLNPADYREHVLPHSQQLIRSLTPGTPVIHFGTGNPALLKVMREAGGDVIGVDWRVELDEAWKAIGYDVGIQGNLDPMVLLAKPDVIRAQVQRILKQAAGRPGHIFNLGHGILPRTPVAHVRLMVDTVHELSRQKSK